MIETNYRAFISYNHKDRDKAVWLQRQLESYRVPRKLVHVLTSEGSVPRRLTPIFRDEECMAAGDLSDGVKDALKHSRFLIVICSPDGAASEWVDREVRLFKEMHGDAGERRVLCAVVRGAAEEAESAPLNPSGLLPKACVFRLGPGGVLSDTPVEPLAADLRFSEKHAKKGFLKIVSGLIGVGLDDLLDRDFRRKQNYMRSVAGVASAAAMLTGGLAWIAIDARNEARRQRNEAEGLVEFMLTDLKAKLDAVGRLDALESVGDRALKYYAGQEKSGLDGDSLGRRARAQLLVGEIDNLRGDLDAALRAYQEAAATTSEQLRRDPYDSQRIFDHAQSVFWVGYVAWQRGDLAKAEAQFRDYKSLAERLIAIDPEKPEWRTELGYAHNNLGTLSLELHRYAAAATEFRAALAIKRDLLRKDPSNVATLLTTAQGHSWLARALDEAGDYDAAKAELAAELEIYEMVEKLDPMNNDAGLAKANAMRALASVKLDEGALDQAIAIFNELETTIEAALRVEPEHTTWLERLAGVELELANAHLFAGAHSLASQHAAKFERVVRNLFERDNKVRRWKAWMLRSILIESRISLAQRAPCKRMQEFRNAISEFEDASGVAEAQVDDVGQAYLEFGRCLDLAGDTTGARDAWRKGAAAYRESIDAFRPVQRIPYARLLAANKQFIEARQILASISPTSRHPAVAQLEAELGRMEHNR